MSDQSSNRTLTSKAVTYKALGGPEVIQFVERTVRAPAAGEVRIEVKAAAVNPADIMFRDPGWPNMTSNIVPGMDAAGVIESVGPGVSRLHPGQKVMAVACSPKADPCVMRVPRALRGKETLDEKDEAPAGADHQEAA